MAVQGVTNKSYFNWSRLLLIAISIILGYGIVLLYAAGETTFGLLGTVIFASALYIFLKSHTYPYRYIYPSILGITAFILFPLIYTINLSFTNYAGTNRLSVEQAYRFLLEQTYLVGEQSYQFQLRKTKNNRYQLFLLGETEQFETPIFSLDTFTADPGAAQVKTVIAKPLQKKPVEIVSLSIRELIQLREQLQRVNVILPNEVQLQFSSLRTFSAIAPLYSPIAIGSTIGSGYEVTQKYTLLNRETNQIYAPN